MASLGKPELDFIRRPLIGEGDEIAEGFLFNEGVIRLVNVFGLGLPRLSTKEELVTERGVFQHGSTTTMVKLPPARDWGMVFEFSGIKNRQHYWEFRKTLIELFNPSAHAYCGFDKPVPHIYTKVLPNGERFHLDFFYRSGLEFNDASPDGRWQEVTVRLTSPDVTMYGDAVSLLFDDPATYFQGGAGGIVVPFPVVGDRRRFLGDPATQSNIYQYTGSWCTCPKMEFTVEPNGDASYTLLSLLLYDFQRNLTFRFDNVDWPNNTASWGVFNFVNGNPDKIIMDVCERTLIRIPDNGNGTPQILHLQAHPKTDWTELNLTPPNDFLFGLEIADPSGNVNVSSVKVDFVPRFIGI